MCLLSPLLFLIFFSEAVEHMRSVQLQEGSFLLGALAAVVILFADDVAFIGRSLADLQKLLDAWGRFCDTKHEQVAVVKTKAMCFRSTSSAMRLSEGKLYRRVRFEERSVVAHFFDRLLRRGNGSPVFAWEPLSLICTGGVQWNGSRYSNI